MKNSIRNSSGQTLGFTIEQGDRIEIHEVSGALRGFYLKSQDKTFGNSGELKGLGNQLLFLLKS